MIIEWLLVASCGLLSIGQCILLKEIDMLDEEIKNMKQKINKMEQKINKIERCSLINSYNNN
jgi:wobble nucleotide-excising tRNase